METKAEGELIVSFANIAQPLISLGIPVFPLSPGTKIPPKDFHFKEEATTNATRITEWDSENPEYNVAIYLNGTYCALEFDVKGGMTDLCKKLGQEIPKTRVQISAGKQCGHFIFKSTDYSRRIGNRSANLPDGSGEWFSFRQHGKYLVGAGSYLSEYDRTYETKEDVEPVEIPDWLVDAIAERTAAPIIHTNEFPALAADVDGEDVVNWYAEQQESGFGIQGRDSWDGKPVLVTDICINAGYKHSGSKATGFIIGDTLGYKCFSQDCDGIGIGQVLRKLHEQGCKSFPRRIWEEQEMDWSMIGRTEEEECTRPAPVEGLSAVELAKLVHATITPAPSPLEFPPAALYGKLGEVARSLDVPLGLAYPAVLAVASAWGPREASDNVRANIYVANIAGVGTGKSVALKRALQAIFLPEGCVIKSAGSSDRGMIKILGTTGSTQLLAQDEFRHMMSKMATPGSGIGLTAICCSLWSDNMAGAADKHGTEECDALLSILGNLPCATPNDFAKMFGTETTKGLADRFIYGYTDGQYNYRPASIKKTYIELRPVSIPYPGPVWQRIDAWTSQNGRRETRLGENAMRVALITAACNEEIEVSDECLDAALRFTEWQEQLRTVFKPGVAENKEAEATSDIVDALYKHLQHQLSNNETPQGAEDVRDLNWTRILNSGSFYRKYGVNLINRVKKGLLDEGIIAEVKKEEMDATGASKMVKTKFIHLRRQLG